jgi:hypothetical protein
LLDAGEGLRIDLVAFSESAQYASGGLYVYQLLPESRIAREAAMGATRFPVLVPGLASRALLRRVVRRFWAVNSPE